MRYSYWTDLQGIQLEEGDTPTWIQAMPYGDFDHPLHGTLHLTKEKATRIAENIKNGVRGQDLDIDYDHKADPAKGKKAAGWVQDVQVRDDGLYLAVKFTPEAKAAVAAGEYRYFSPEYFDKWSDPRGGKHQDVLAGGALTNRPHLKGILPINLSELSNEEEGEVDEFLKELRTKLGLPETATEAEILTAAAAKPEIKPDDKPEPKVEDKPEVKPEVKPEEKVPVAASEAVTQLSETVKEQAKQLAEMRTKLAEESAARTLTEWNTQGKYALPTSLHESAKAILLSEQGAEFTKFMEGLRETGLVQLGESGRNHPETNGGKKAQDEFEEKARQLMESEKLDYGDAVVKLAESEPALFEKYQREMVEG